MAQFLNQQGVELQCQNCLHQQVCRLTCVLAEAQKTVSDVVRAEMEPRIEKGFTESDFILPVQVRCKHFYQKQTYGVLLAAEEAAQCSS